jgi:hypothetical protein
MTRERVKGSKLVPLESGKIMAIQGHIDWVAHCPMPRAVGWHCIPPTKQAGIKDYPTPPENQPQN